MPTPQYTRAQLYRRLMSYLLPYWQRFTIALVAMTLSASTEAIFSRLMKPLMDVNFDPRTNVHTLYLVPLFLVILFVVRALANFVNEYLTTWLANSLVFRLRQEMFSRVLQLPIRYFEDTTAGRLISRLAFDVNAVSSAGFNIITVVVKDGLTIVFLVISLLITDWQLTMVCFVVLPLIANVVRYTNKRIRGIALASQEAIGGLIHVIEEAVHGMRVVRIFGGQDYETRRFEKAAHEYRRLALRETARSSQTDGTVQVLLGIAMAVIIFVATYRAHTGSLTRGDFMAFITAMMLMMAPIKRMTGVNDSLQKGLAAAESVFTLLDSPMEVDSGTHSLPGRVRGEVSFEQLSFHYNESSRKALNRFDLRIGVGQTVALVGTSGSGKTTAASLLPLFYRPQEGRLLLDGLAVEDIPLRDLRRQIALVSQDVVLFNDTIAANIAYGQPEASREAIVAAARAAYALEFIEAQPQGFDTYIGERGAKLSGGQRQRLAIARALLKDAPILILDEATSALDSESERQVQAALDQLMQNRTTLVIAHRLSTIEKADLIVVMAHGQAVEQGTHEELLARQGVYYQMQHTYRDTPPQNAHTPSTPS